MAYGILKCDNITFDNGGSDQNVTVSGLYRATTSGVTVTGTISGAVLVGTTTVSGATVTGNVVQGTTVQGVSGSFTSLTGTTTSGTTANFVSGVFTTQVSGTTVTGTTSSFTSGNFATLSGATATFTSGVIASGTATNPSLSFVSDLNTGIYSPGADQLAISTNGTGRLTIDASGKLLIGTGSLGGQRVQSTDGFLSVGDGAGFRALNSSVTSAGSLVANAGSGAGATLSSEGGPLLVIAGGSERLRIDSSGNVGIGTTSPGFVVHANRSTAVDTYYGSQNSLALSLFGTDSAGGTVVYNGSAYPIQFSTNGTERARIDSSGRLLVGTSTSSSFNHQLQVRNDDGAVSEFFTASVVPSLGPYSVFSRSRGSAASPTIVSSGDSLGVLYFSGYSGAAYVGAATIIAEVDGTPGTDDMPGRLVFSTTADGASSPTERMRITSTGQMRLAGAGITFNGDTAAANELDDYEEGTYSPSIDNWSGTYTTQQGQYVKIGKKVYAAGKIITIGGSGSFVDSLNITMPFAGSTSISSPNFGIWTIVDGSTGVPSSVVAGGPLGGPISNANAFMNTFNTGGNSGNWSALYCDASVACEFRFHCTYFV